MVVWHVLETARSVISSLFQNIHLTGQQRSPVTKEKIVAVLERLHRLELGKSKDVAVDKDESTRRDTLLSSVIPLLPDLQRLNPF